MTDMHRFPDRILRRYFGGKSSIDPEDLNSALLEASEIGDKDAVKKFLRAGADPNATNEDGWTPLMLACGSNAITCVEILLNHATTNVHALNNGDFEAIEIANEQGHEKIVSLLVKTAQKRRQDRSGPAPGTPPTPTQP